MSSGVHPICRHAYSPATERTTTHGVTSTSLVANTVAPRFSRVSSWVMVAHQMASSLTAGALHCRMMSQ